MKEENRKSMREEGDEEIVLQEGHACSACDKFLFYRQLWSNYVAIFGDRMEGNVRLYTEGLQRINFTFFDKNDRKNGRGKKIPECRSMRKDLNGPPICINLRGTLGKIADKIQNISSESSWG
jgi:hypothetical protein